MKTKVRMNNGDEFIVDIHVSDFVRATKNQMGVTINGLIAIGELYINPVNICTATGINE